MAFNYDQYFSYDNEPHATYLCVDMKSFYASVECVERGLKPLKALLVVMSGADSPGGLALAASPMARDYIGNAMIELEEANEDFPIFELDSINDISKNNNGFVTSVDIDFKKFKAASDNRTIKKTLTIPNYLNVLAIEKNINFSELLTNSLKHELNV